MIFIYFLLLTWVFIVIYEGGRYSDDIRNLLLRLFDDIASLLSNLTDLLTYLIKDLFLSNASKSFVENSNSSRTQFLQNKSSIVVKEVDYASEVLSKYE